MRKLLRNVTLKQVLDRLKNEVLYGRTYLHVAKGLLDSDSVIRQIAPVFFGITTDAHLEQAMMVIARLYDVTEGAVTIPRMLDLAASEVGSFRRGTPQEVSSAIAKAREAIENLTPVLDSLKVRRDKWMAHLDPRPISNPSAFSEQAKQLTIPELEQAFKETDWL